VLEAKAGLVLIWLSRSLLQAARRAKVNLIVSSRERPAVEMLCGFLMVGSFIDVVQNISLKPEPAAPVGSGFSQ
jgi:hypothetical protein